MTVAWSSQAEVDTWLQNVTWRCTRLSDFRELGLKRWARSSSKKKVMERRIAICGSCKKADDFVRGGGGGGVKLTPPVKIGLIEPTLRHTFNASTTYPRSSSSLWTVSLESSSSSSLRDIPSGMMRGMAAMQVRNSSIFGFLSFLWKENINE